MDRRPTTDLFVASGASDIMAVFAIGRDPGGLFVLVRLTLPAPAFRGRTTRAKRAVAAPRQYAKYAFGLILASSKAHLACWTGVAPRK